VRVCGGEQVRNGGGVPVTLGIQAGHSAGEGRYGVCDYRRDMAEVGERAARWLASENLTSGPGWSSLHDLIFEEALTDTTSAEIHTSRSGSEGLTE
jgi:hypothetical protein